MSKPILCLDFDGVIHSYEKGWQGGEIYGNLTPGFLAWALEANQHFQLVIYSSRSKTAEGITAMQDWLQAQLRERIMPNETTKILEIFSFAHEKPPAFITIDDRALTFIGDWGAYQPKELLNFKPWNIGQKQPPTAPTGEAPAGTSQ